MSDRSHHRTQRRAALGIALGAAALVMCGCRGGTSRGGAGGARDAGSAAGAGTTAAPAPAPITEWNKQEVVKRLTDAGLVVTDASQHVRHPPLTVTGDLLHVGGGQLEIYVYPTDAARRRESAKLDTATVGLPTIYSPRWVISGNIVAILRTPDERAADRVINTLLAFHTTDGT